VKNYASGIIRALFLFDPVILWCMKGDLRRLSIPHDDLIAFLAFADVLHLVAYLKAHGVTLWQRFARALGASSQDNGLKSIFQLLLALCLLCGHGLLFLSRRPR
jgi:hypothetical protein